MLLRASKSILCAGLLFVANLVHAVDVSQCSMVADGRAEIIHFDARMADGRKVELDGLLAGPGGAGPFPAIVMLPGGGGLFTPYCYRAVVEAFVNWGFVTLIVASTTAHDDDGNHVSRYSFADQASHSYGAISAVETIPEVDRSRIGIWGHSLGGLSVIHAVSSITEKPGMLFQAAVAIAPLCPAQPASPTVPMLVMIGEKDNEVSVDACVDFAARLDGIGGLEFLLIPEAGHLYWAPGAPGYNEASAMLSEKRLKTFLAKHLQVAR